MGEVTKGELSPKPLSSTQRLKAFLGQNGLTMDTLYSIGGDIKDPLHPVTSISNVRNLEYMFDQSLVDEVKLRIAQRGYVHVAQRFGFTLDGTAPKGMTPEEEFAAVVVKSQSFVEQKSKEFAEVAKERKCGIEPVHPLTGEPLADDSLILLQMRYFLANAPDQEARTLHDQIVTLADIHTRYSSITNFASAAEVFPRIHTMQQKQQLLTDVVARAKGDVLQGLEKAYQKHRAVFIHKWEANPQKAFAEIPKQLDKTVARVEEKTWVPRYDPDVDGNPPFEKGSVAHALLALSLEDNSRPDVLLQRKKTQDEKKEYVSRRRTSRRADPIVKKESEQKSAFAQLVERANVMTKRTSKTDTMSQAGLDPDFAQHRWGIGGSRDFWDNFWKRKYSTETVFSENITILKKLEKDRPGSAQVLYKEFGILNYTRYPYDLLIDQYDHINDTDGAYGVLLFGTADHNGALLSKKESLQTFYEDAKKAGVHLRVCEADTKLGLAKSLVRLRSRYAKKISFALINGHGSENSIQLGGEKGEEHIYSQDLEGDGTLALHDFFEDQAIIVLASCSTGMPGGIAAKLYQRTGFHLLAPDNSTNVVSLRLLVEKGKFVPKVSYWAGTRVMEYGGKKSPLPPSESPVLRTPSTVRLSTKPRFPRLTR